MTHYFSNFKILLKAYLRLFKFSFVEFNHQLTQHSKLTNHKVLKNSNKTLKEIFDNLGCDKGAFHGYWQIYEEDFAQIRNNQIVITEIGIGSSNPDIPQNMGIGYESGKSLLAWQEYFSSAKIIGLDIDTESFVKHD